MLAAFVIATALLGAAPQDGASPAPAPGDDRFATLVESSDKFLTEQDPGAALWSLRAADAQKPTPEVALKLASIYGQLNDPAMQAYYQRLYLRRAPQAGDSLEVAEGLGKILAGAEADGRGLLEVDAPVDGELTVQDRTFPGLPAATFLPPGEYTLHARVGEVTMERQVSVQTGRVAHLSLDATPPPLLSAEESQGPFSFLKGESGRATLHATSMGLVGLSVVALAVGSVFGAMSAGDVGRLSSEKASLTVSQANQIADGAGSKGGTANALWVAGGVGALAGGALFLLSLPPAEASR